MFNRSTARIVTSVLLVCLVFASSLAAQTEPPPLPELKKDDFFSRGFVHRLLSDQKAMWTSPVRVKPSDAKWLVPLAAGTGLLFAKDSQISHEFDQRSSLRDSSLKVSKVGPYAMWSMPAALLAIGKLSGNQRMSDAGQHGFQAALYSMITMQTLKHITNRTRPDQGGDGRFWTGGTSFPSGHAMESWALAKVVSDEYSDKRFIQIGMYSFATAVSLSRMTSERHYASDVLVGSALGYLIGKFVMRNHHP